MRNNKKNRKNKMENRKIDLAAEGLLPHNMKSIFQMLYPGAWIDFIKSIRFRLKKGG